MSTFRKYLPSVHENGANRIKNSNFCIIFEPVFFYVFAAVSVRKVNIASVAVIVWHPIITWKHEHGSIHRRHKTQSALPRSNTRSRRPYSYVAGRRRASVAPDTAVNRHDIKGLGATLSVTRISSEQYAVTWMLDLRIGKKKCHHGA